MPARPTLIYILRWPWSGRKRVTLPPSEAASVDPFTVVFTRCCVECHVERPVATLRRLRSASGDRDSRSPYGFDPRTEPN